MDIWGAADDYRRRSGAAAPPTLLKFSLEVLQCLCVFAGDDHEQELHHGFGRCVWPSGRVASAARGHAVAGADWGLVYPRMGFVAGRFAGRRLVCLGCVLVCILCIRLRQLP